MILHASRSTGLTPYDDRTSAAGSFLGSLARSLAIHDDQWPALYDAPALREGHAWLESKWSIPVDVFAPLNPLFAAIWRDAGIAAERGERQPDPSATVYSRSVMMGVQQMASRSDFVLDTAGVIRRAIEPYEIELATTREHDDPSRQYGRIERYQDLSPVRLRDSGSILSLLARMVMEPIGLDGTGAGKSRRNGLLSGRNEWNDDEIERLGEHLDDFAQQLGDAAGNDRDAIAQINPLRLGTIWQMSFARDYGLLIRCNILMHSKWIMHRVPDHIDLADEGAVRAALMADLMMQADYVGSFTDAHI